MKKQLLTRMLISFSLVIVLLAGLSIVGLAQGGSRPPYSTPVPTSPPDGGSSDSAVSVSANCAAVYGQAVNWGFDNQGGVGLHLMNGSWQTSQVTSDDGYYHFGNLGAGIGKLKVDADNLALTPMINDAVVRLTCDFHTQANIGLYSGSERPQPPVQIRFSRVPESVSAGDSTVLMLKVKNTLPTPISQVIITNLFPEGLTIKTVNASVGKVETLNGNMLTVILGSLPSGAEESIAITLHVADNLTPNTELRDTATLFYAESVADQTHFTLKVNGAEDTAETASISALPLAAAAATYTIQEGDVLYKLASEYNVSVETLMATNNITNNQPLQAGQQLIIPTEETTALAQVNIANITEKTTPTMLPVTGVGISFSAAGILLVVIAALVGKGVHSAKNHPR